jgi:hypothetical protein
MGLIVFLQAYSVRPVLPARDFFSPSGNVQGRAYLQDCSGCGLDLYCPCSYHAGRYTRRGLQTAIFVAILVELLRCHGSNSRIHTILPSDLHYP